MKTAALERMGERLELLSAHDALILLRNSFALTISCSKQGKVNLMKDFCGNIN